MKSMVTLEQIDRCFDGNWDAFYELLYQWKIGKNPAVPAAWIGESWQDIWNNHAGTQFSIFLSLKILKGMEV